MTRVVGSSPLQVQVAYQTRHQAAHRAFSMGLDRRKSSRCPRGRRKLSPEEMRRDKTVMLTPRPLRASRLKSVVNVVGVFFLLCSMLTCCVGQQASDDWPPSNCPKKCKCTWTHGKKTVDCHNAGFSQVPDSLSPLSQVLDLSKNTIRALPKDKFKSSGLENLQKVFLRSCKIEKVDRDAFRDLKIMIELDLSGNKIETLHADSFKSNERLRELRLKDNPLVKLQGQFPPLLYLRILDLSNCQLSEFPPNIFDSLTNLEQLDISGNRFHYISEATIRPLAKLKSLSLKNNSWRCDCDLKHFRDWAIPHSFYEQTTACSEPSHLAGFQWTKLQSSDFACKPDIVALQINGKATEAFIVAADVGRNITLECLVRGTPAPDVKWVRDGQVLANSSRNHGKPYLLHISGETERWVNLTIVKSDLDDAGEYTCVGTNAGGVVEKNLTLNFQDVPPIGTGVGPGLTNSHSLYADQSWIWVVIGILASLVLITMTIMIVCFCARRRRIKSARAQDLKNEAKLNGSVAGYTECPTQTAKPDVPKQNVITLSSDNVSLSAKGQQPMSVVTIRRGPRLDGYEGLPQTEFELSDLPSMSQHHHPHHQCHPHHGLYPSCNYSDSGSASFVPTENRYDDTRILLQGGPIVTIPSYSTPMGHELSDQQNQQLMEGSTPLLSQTLRMNAIIDSTNTPGDYPDLLDIPQRSQDSPAASIASTLPDSTRLIMPQQLNPAALAMLDASSRNSQYGYVLPPHQRPHSPYAASVCSFTSEPAVIVPPPHRPGYVTLPRRPRVPSWSPAFSPISPSPTGTLPIVKVGPKYDNLGPRTTADGSSKLSLNKIADGSNPSIKTPTSALSPAIRKILSPTSASPTPPFVFAPIQEQEPGLSASNSDLHMETLPRGWRVGSDSVPSSPSDHHGGTTPLIKKVPPKPPPKPSKKLTHASHKNKDSSHPSQQLAATNDDGTEV